MANIALIGPVDGATPTSEDERQYREMMKDELLLAQPDSMYDIPELNEVAFRGQSPMFILPAETRRSQEFFCLRRSTEATVAGMYNRLYGL